jgi:hypothetical protein
LSTLDSIGDTLPSLRLTNGVETLPFSTNAFAHARGRSSPVSLRSLLASAGTKTRRIRVGVLRYAWQTPGPEALTTFPEWEDSTFSEVFANDTWSVAAFWLRATLGLLAPEFELQPWRELPLTENGQEEDRSGMINLIRSQAANDGVNLTAYDQVIAFIHPPPSGAGAVGNPGDALLDENAALFFYQHECGHIIGFQHSCGPTDTGTFAEYHDPYCVMGYSMDQGHSIPADGSLSGIQLGSTANFDFWNSDRRLAAAALYRHVPMFASSASVIRISRASTTDVRLVGLGVAELLDPVIAVVATAQGEVTVEYRPAIGDDAGVAPPAVVVHSIGRRTVPGPTQTPAVYEGGISIPVGGSYKTLEGDVTVSLMESTPRAATVTIHS